MQTGEQDETACFSFVFDVAVSSVLPKPASKRHGFRHVSSIHQVHLRSYLSLVSLRHRDIGKKPGHFFSFAFSVRFFFKTKWQSLMRKKWPKNGHAVLRFGLDLDLGSGALKTWE